MGMAVLERQARDQLTIPLTGKRSHPAVDIPGF